jgi:hypothetical protein
MRRTDTPTATAAEGTPAETFEPRRNKVDWDTMGPLVLSLVIFAPGVILLTVLLFVGLLMGLEKMGAFKAFISDEPTKQSELPVGDVSEEPGQVVAGLKGAIEQDANQTKEDIEQQVRDSSSGS